MGSGGGFITNPLAGNIQTLPALLNLVISIVVAVGVPLVTLAIIWAGFLYVSSRGNKSKLDAAHKAIIGAVIGGMIVLGAYVIAGLIQSTISEVTGSGASRTIEQPIG